MQLDVSDLIKTVRTFSFSLKEDFHQYLEKQTGEGKIQDASFQQLSNEGQDHENLLLSSKGIKKQQKQQGDDFYVQGDEQQPVIQTIKTYQFHSGMFAPTKQVQKVIDSKPDIDIQVESYAGYNSKQLQNCVIISQDCYCVSIGCSLLICPLNKEDKCKQYKRFQQHNFQISTLHYSRIHNLFVSGSKGLKPQIIVWQVQNGHQFDKINLKVIKSFKLPRKSQGIRLIQMLNEHVVLCVDTISIHRGNSLYSFDIKSGKQFKDPIKLQSKVFNMHTSEQTNNIYFATDKGAIKLKNLDAELQKFNEKLKQIMSVSIYKDKIFLGDMKGNLLILAQTGQIIYSDSIHKGWIFKMIALPDQSILITCGQQDSIIKIHKIQQKVKKLTLSLLDSIQLKSYCTSLSYNAESILIGLRDGSVVLYDILSKNKKYEKILYASCLDTQNSKIFSYNQLCERLIIMPFKDILLQISIEDEGSTNKRAQTIQTKLQKKPKCIWIWRDKIIQVIRQSKTKYKILLNHITDIKGKCILQCKLQINIELQNEKSEYKQEQQRKSDELILVRFNEQLAFFGTKGGRVVVYNFKDQLTLTSSQFHKNQVEEIIIQQGSVKIGQPFYIKTVSKSQLFYWQIKLQEQKIRKINKAAPVKDIKWCSICKYGWQTKNIWDQMTHFQDISSVAMVGKFLCIAMFDGKLRIYRYPASPKNFQEYRFFADKFRVVSCEKKNNTFICERNCQIIVCKIKPK